MSNDAAIVSLKEKIDGLNQQAWEARVSDSPKAFELSQQAVKLSRDINYPRGLAEGLRSLGFAYVRLYKNEVAASLLSESLTIFKSLNDLKGQAVVYEYLGITERNQGNLGASLELLLKGNSLIRQLRAPEIEITNCYQIGVTYKHLGKHENALDYLYQALSLAKKTDFILMESYAINIIGSIYFDGGDYNHALECFQRGLVIRHESNDKWGEAGSLDNIGFTYLKLKDLDKAIDYCQQSLAISQSTGDKKGEANALLHLAEIYEQADDIKKAAEFSNESLRIRKTRGDKRGEAEVLLFLAGLYKNRNNADDHQVFEWLSGARKIAEEIKAQDLLSKACYDLHDYFRQKGDYKESVAHLETHLQIEKELHKNTITQKVSNLEISHKAEAISQRNKELTELNEQIEKANAELRIGSALERVRTAAMAMNDPADMLEICKIISQELEVLEVKKIRNVQTAIFYEEKGSYMNYEYYAKHDKLITTEVEYTNHPVAEKFANQMLQGANQVWTHAFKGKEVKDWLNYQKTTNVFIDTFLETADSLNYYWYSLGPVALGISTYVPLNEKEIELFKRFRNVFELAYRRFVDIEKALAQAREAQIQLALERVRARTMAMHQSDELSDVVKLLYQEFDTLKINDESTDIEIGLIDEDTGIASIWAHFYLSDGTISTFKFPFTHFEEINDEFEKWKATPVEKRNELFFTTEFSAKQWQRFMRIAEELPELAEIFRPLLEAKITKWVTHNAYFSHGILTLQGTEAYSNETLEIQKRFAKVFEQTYTRFLDLQKAEAQTREAQIETGLERVRSKTMAMHKSEEVTGIAVSLNEELLKLGFEGGSTIIIIDKESGDTEQWTGFSEDKSLKSCRVPYFKHPCHDAQLDAWKKGEKVLVYTLAGDEKRSFDEHYFKTGYQDFPESDKKWMRQMESVTFSYAFMKYGAIHWGPDQLTEEQLRILQRFSKVFEQSYTRFLDLQKAEAQAREAQIEVALEKVRAKVMAMTSSNDLNDTSLVFGEQLRKLGIDWQFSYFWLIEEDKDDNTFWLTWPDNQTSTTTYSLAEADESFRECIVAWRNQEKIHGTHVPLEHVQAWLDTFERITNDAGGAALEVMKPGNFKDGVYYYDAMIKFGSFGILMNRPTNDEEKNIQSRFATEFERAYTRFLDLKKAEAQTREALIEGALERVRARALAMQQPEELKDVAQVLRNEMGALGVEELETSSIYITGDSAEKIECWYALQDPKHTEKKMISDHILLNLNDTWVGREMKRFYVSQEKQTSIVMQGANRKEWIEYCYQHSPVLSGFYGETIPDRTYHLYKFSHGFIGAAAPGDISAESWRLLSRAASVFSLAYSRFKDLTQARNDLIKLKEEKKRAEDALTELQNTQKQLVQSEKMASLGELTAGIAHEIQNPLNFVNNFSDVSNELLEEMKTELATGNTQSAIEIVNDVKGNLEKILHHGKRADAIVKSMLQHSRSSSGKKEPTDINALADEYLRLAYHGLRAKDKSFNAVFETDLDKSIDKINIVPQEIGRVILNLINNAFYAVTEKKKTAANGYQPVVTVSTKHIRPSLGGVEVIEIKVKDNGDGIPQKVLNKIFQPFYTTKPTGQGTGLGLSLSYDIVTKGHGGEIKVETREGIGSEFIISLPVNNSGK